MGKDLWLCEHSAVSQKGVDLSKKPRVKATRKKNTKRTNREMAHIIAIKQLLLSRAFSSTSFYKETLGVRGNLWGLRTMRGKGKAENPPCS